MASRPRTLRTLARRERHALCDLVLALGPDASTVLPDWRTEDLVAHLLVREYRPLGALGAAVEPLSFLAERSMTAMKRRGYAVMVEKLRDPGLTPFALPPVEVVANTFEYFVHHEDVRRAQPDWVPRVLDRADEDTLWTQVGRAGRMLVRPAKVPVVARRTDTGDELVLRKGPDPAVVAGLPSELTLFLFGRDEVRGVEVTGAGADALREASLGF